MREVEDILLASRKVRENGRAACAERSEREQGHEIT